jgi:DNA processing protein
VRRKKDRAPTPVFGATGATGSSNDAVVAALGSDALHVDAVAAAAGLASAQALSVLLELELDGRVVRLPGMRFSCV